MTAATPGTMTTNVVRMLESAQEGATVVLPPGHHVIREPIVLTKSLVVRGAPDGTTVIDGNGVCGVFMLLGNRKRFVFETLTIQGGAGRMGGAILAPNRNEIAFEGCRFANNDTETGGGAAMLHHARGYFRRCIFEHNESTYGGALGVGTQCDVTLDRCVFAFNRGEAGGAIFLDDDGALEIRNCTFVGNVAKNDEMGMAMYVFGNRNDGPSSFIANTIFAEEKALSSDPSGAGTVFLTHTIVPAGVFGHKGFTNVGGNVTGPVDLVDLGGGAWAIAASSEVAFMGDVQRIDRGAVDLTGMPLVQTYAGGSRASPGAVVPRPIA